MGECGAVEGIRFSNALVGQTLDIKDGLNLPIPVPEPLLTPPLPSNKGSFVDLNLSPVSKHSEGLLGGFQENHNQFDVHEDQNLLTGHVIREQIPVPVNNVVPVPVPHPVVIPKLIPVPIPNLHENEGIDPVFISTHLPNHQIKSFGYGYGNKGGSTHHHVQLPDIKAELVPVNYPIVVPQYIPVEIIEKVPVPVYVPGGNLKSFGTWRGKV